MTFVVYIGQSENPNCELLKSAAHNAYTTRLHSNFTDYDIIPHHGLPVSFPGVGVPTKGTARVRTAGSAGFIF